MNRGHSSRPLTYCSSYCGDSDPSAAAQRRVRPLLKCIISRMKKHSVVVTIILLLLCEGTYANEKAPAETKRSKVYVPKIDGEYINIYKPAGDIFPGPSVGQLVVGKYYEEWVPNDHCFVKDQAGRWHIFGITHPITDFDNVHLGENQSFHAIAPSGSLEENLKEGTWKDRPKVLPPAERPGEIPANHAPFIIKHDGLYHMIYGPTPIRYAVSMDMFKWIPMRTLGNAPEGRDPSILFWNDTYYLIVCGIHDVRIATSRDFTNWDQHAPILTMKKGVDPESPSIVRYNNTFYLFVCGWNGVWDRKELQGAYQHITYVYQSDNPLKFDVKNEVTTVNSHAPEIFQDEKGDWYISSVECPHRGVSIARLSWE
jgi:arabinan endo-1,5-alpha-L-arabinosidase